MPAASTQDYLSSHFERSRADVIQYTHWIEETYARPALGNMQLYYREHPLLAVFFAVFATLSLPPIAIYLGLCLFALTLLLLSSLSIIAIMFFTVALTLGSILALVLLTNLCLAVVFTFSLITTYLAYKIAVAGYTGGLHGARLQVIEFYNAFFSAAQTRFSKESPERTWLTENDDLHEHSEGSGSSPDSTVFIGSSELHASSAMSDDNPADMKLEESDY